MGFVHQFKSDLLKSDNTDFEDNALSLFRFQYKNNLIYRNYVQALNVNPEKVNSIEQIPFFPISFYKNFKITCSNHDPINYFESSGTTGVIRSRLYYSDKDFYLQNSKLIFESLFGALSDYSFFFLLLNFHGLIA